MTDDHGIHPGEAPGEPTPGPHGWVVRHVAETGSTNADLLALVDDATPGERLGRVVLRTDHQTAGRGRLDRRWDAPPGSNLLVSLLFPEPPSSPQLAVQAVALAALRAVDEVLGDDHRAALKWPNDLLLDDRKLAGVLAQRHATGPVVVGIGLNVGWAPDGAACLARATGPDRAPTPAGVLDRMLEHLDELVVDDRLDREVVTRGVRERLATLGREVRLELPGDRLVTGRAVAFGDDGRLGVDVDGDGSGPPSGDGGDVSWFDVGDVVHLRPAT